MSASSDIEKWIVTLREASGATGTEAIAYGQGEIVKLRGPSAGVLELKGPGAAGGVPAKSVQWLPVDKRVLDLEVRIKCVAYNHPGPGDVPDPTAPDVRAHLSFGHGAAVWESPGKDHTGLPSIIPWAVPARGAVWRVNARELSVTVSATNLAYATARVAVSIQPCSGGPVAVVPPVDYASGLSEDPLRYSVFPAEAHKFRLINPATSRPFTPGQREVKIVSSAGVGTLLTAAIDAQLYNDPHAIPVQALGILADGDIAVEYG